MYKGVYKMDYKKILAAAAITTTAIVIPVATQAATVPNNTIPTMNATFKDMSLDVPAFVQQANVGSTISVGFSFPAQTTIASYEWYIYDNGAYFLLTSEKDMLIDIPPLASGKSLRLVVTTPTGEQYRADLPVKQLELVDDLPMDIYLNDRVINDPSTVSLAANDVLSVENLEILGKNGEELTTLQAEISYQWYFTTPTGEIETSSLITEATNASFSIPKDAYFRTLQSFKVRVDIEVPDAGVKKSYYSQPITLNIAPAENLIAEINALFETPYKYSATAGDFLAFKAHVNALLKSYNALSINSKLLITNYDQLLNAQTHVQTVEPLIKLLEAFHSEKQAFDAAETELKHAKLLEQFAQIEKVYKRLGGLQRSLLDLTDDFGNNYVEEMFKFLRNIKELEDNSDTTAETINQINSDIMALFLNNGADFVKEYELNGATREEFATRVLLLQERAAAVDKVHQPVLHTTLLKNAKKDLQKAHSVAEKIKKVGLTSGIKQINAAAAARQAYNKLSTLQKSLIAPEEFELLTGTEDTAEQRAADIIAGIDQLITNGTYNVGDEFTFNNTNYSFAAALDYLAQAYKSLNAGARVKVTNIEQLKIATRDFKAASKVITNINKAVLLYEAAGNAENTQSALRKAYAAYSTAYKGYVKLSPLQRSMLNGNNSMEDDIEAFLSDYASLSDLVNMPADDSAAAETYDAGKVANVVSLLEELEASISTNPTTLEDVQAKIAAIKTAYSDLKGAEKKNVFNYSVLSTANSVANKASTVQKRLRAAHASNSQSKLSSALTAYSKLTAPQRQLIVSTAEEVAGLLTEMQPDYAEIKDALAILADELTGLNIANVTELVQGVPAKELKALPYYKEYQDALKQKAVVDNFVGKINKLGENPSFSKRQTALANYKKLTTTQAELFAESYTEFAELLESWDTELLDVSTNLNDRIGNLLVSGVYSADEVTGEGLEFVDNFIAYINELEDEYKALDQKERRLITHKGYFSIAKKDAKAIQPLIRLVATIEGAETNMRASLITQAERTFDRLSVQQQQLFELSGVVIPAE